MPKIVIREFDKTKAGVANYANFAVVVPGYVAADHVETAEEVFDEYGIYECSDQAEFVNKIGQTGQLNTNGENIIKPAVAPEAEAITETIESVDALQQLREDLNAEKYGLYFATIRSDGKSDIGNLKDAQYIYTEITEESELEEVPSNLYKIKEEKEGSEEVTAYHMGNQIAYELLGLGYTVLYKKINNNADLLNTKFYEDEEESFWAPLKDKAIYDFRYVVSGLLGGDASVNNEIIKLVNAVNTNTNTGRGDCIALLDIDANAYLNASVQKEAIAGIAANAGQITASKYAALFAPIVTYNRPKDFYQNNTFPASFHYLACAAKAAENYNEWYAVAGYTRGVSNYSIQSVGCRLGEAAIEALEPRNKADKDSLDKAVNLIVKIKNSYYLWGNRTAELLGAAQSNEPDLRASHFLNIRQLCTTLKKQVYVACRRFTFDPNSDVLWINFCNALKPTLERMKADQGISDYKIVKVKSAQKALLTAKIRIVPIEAVEDFDISITLEDSLGGVTTGIDEN